MKTKPNQSNYKLKCKICGETFYPTAEERDLFEDGFAELPRECEFCFNSYTNEPEIDSHSDADMGL